MKKFGFLDKAVSYLKEAGMEVQLFEGIEPDPSVETVMKGAQAMLDFGPDWIIAMGGGSPIDAAKAMCERAGKNAVLSGLGDRAMRYIVDDCLKFVEREIRRGNRYDAVIMDPPSYGRGPKGEIWKIEDTVFDFVRKAVCLLTDEPLFFLINSYTTGLQPTVMKNISDIALNGRGNTLSYELTLPTGRKEVLLPSGASAFTTF